MAEMFLCQYSTGSYSDYTETNVFVTSDESLAKAWVESGKKLIKEVNNIKYPKWNWNKGAPAHGMKSWTEFQEKQKETREERLRVLGDEYRELEVYANDADLSLSYFPIEVR